MTDTSDSGTASDTITLSVDAMGGDKGPAAVVAGLSVFLGDHPRAHVLLHGDGDTLHRMVARKSLGSRVTVCPAEGVVTMDDKPSQVMRRGKGTSMWSAVEAVRDGVAQAVVSCGNTGALMAVSMLRLRKAEGVNRPAIACLWPSRSKGGFNIMLDVGADIRADQDDLLTYAFMGASYARNGMGIDRPKVGLLNVGTEDHKGRAELKVAHEMIQTSAKQGDFDYVGFIEGSDIPSNKVDVIVTDGFTGNVALKTGEGTATIIGERLREAFKGTLLSRLSALIGGAALTRFRESVDPRRANGGVFLGLGGTVVKSHGSADATGVDAALRLAYQLAEQNFADRLAKRIAAAAAMVQDLPKEAET